MQFNGRSEVRISYSFTLSFLCYHCFSSTSNPSSLSFSLSLSLSPSLSLSISLILYLFLSVPFTPLHSSSLSPWSILSRLLISSHLVLHPALMLFFILPQPLPLPLPLPLNLLNIIQPSSVLRLLLNCDHRTKAVKEKRNFIFIPKRDENPLSHLKPVQPSKK